MGQAYDRARQGRLTVDHSSTLYKKKVHVQAQEFPFVAT